LSNASATVARALTAPGRAVSGGCAARPPAV